MWIAFASRVLSVLLPGATGLNRTIILSIYNTRTDAQRRVGLRIEGEEATEGLKNWANRKKEKKENPLNEPLARARTLTRSLCR